MLLGILHLPQIKKINTILSITVRQRTVQWGKAGGWGQESEASAGWGKIARGRRTNGSLEGDDRVIRETETEAIFGQEATTSVCRYFLPHLQELTTPLTSIHQSIVRNSCFYKISVRGRQIGWEYEQRGEKTEQVTTEEKWDWKNFKNEKNVKFLKE